MRYQGGKSRIAKPISMILSAASGGGHIRVALLRIMFS